jgi:hypothetical protein
MELVNARRRVSLRAKTNIKVTIMLLLRCDCTSNNLKNVEKSLFAEIYFISDISVMSHNI